MIESIEFKNFKVLRDTTLPLGRLTLLLGPNGSGKSTALSGFQAVLHPGRFPRPESRSALGTTLETSVVIRWTDAGWCGATWPQKTGTHLTGDSNQRSCLSPIRVYSFIPEALARPAGLQPNAEMGPHGENLAIVLDRLRDDAPERFENLNDEIHESLPEFDRVLFETAGGGSRSFALRTTIGGHKILAPDLSDGTLLAVAILTLAHLPEPPPLVGLEEPDHGIHPRLLRRVHDALHRLAYPEEHGEARPPVQVIATTHSPYFLDLFRDHPEEIVLARKEADGAFFERLSDRPDLEEILSDAPLGEVWYSGILGGVPAES